jgi:DNA ligase-1
MGGYTIKYKRLTACNTLVKPYRFGMEFALLKDWSGQDVSPASDGGSWLISEKRDGFRLGWTGTEFVSRDGNVFNAPDWFRAGLPSFALDGELFAGRGGFNSIRRLMSKGWHGLTFEVFDVPCSEMPFAARARVLGTICLPIHVKPVPHRLCVNIGDLMGMACRICNEGGEGAVVRRVDSMWKAGRSGDVLRYVPQSPRLNRVK